MVGFGGWVDAYNLRVQIVTLVKKCPYCCVKIIPRSINVFSESDFASLLKIYNEIEWLNRFAEEVEDLWLILDTVEQKKLVEDLLSNFKYIDGNKVFESLKILVNQIENVWELEPENTFLVATSDGNRPDGSQVLIQWLKNKFSVGWREKNFYNSILPAAHTINSNCNIVLVDDFIGTGDTIERRVRYIKEKLVKRSVENVKLFIISIGSMKISEAKISLTGAEFFSVYLLNKGITETYLGDEKVSAIKNMESLESKLRPNIGKRRLPNFGYKSSEALFAIENCNIPNNVFPIFWWPELIGGESRKTIFRRV